MWRERGFTCGCLAVCAWLAWNAFSHPLNNWDMLAYIGAAFEMDGQERQAWFTRSKDDLFLSMPEQEAHRIMDVPLAANADVLAQQMPFYRIKPLYVMLIYILHGLGMHAGTASYALSVAAAFAIAVLLVGVEPGGRSPAWRLGALAFVALFPPGLFGLARFSVPDVLAACLALYAYHALLLRGKLGIGFALALLSVLARTDMLPLCILLLAAYGCRFGRVAAILACCALSCAVVLCVLHAAHYYGLAVHLEYHFIHKSPDVALLKGDIRLIDYLDLLLRSIAEALKNPGVLLLALWTLVVMARTRQVPDGLFIAWLYMAAKLVIFPEWEERYILICYLMAFSSGAALLSRKEKHDQYS